MVTLFIGTDVFLEGARLGLAGKGGAGGNEGAVVVGIGIEGSVNVPPAPNKLPKKSFILNESSTDGVVLGWRGIRGLFSVAEDSGALAGEPAAGEPALVLTECKLLVKSVDEGQEALRLSCSFRECSGRCTSRPLAPVIPAALMSLADFPLLLGPANKESRSKL